MLHRCPWLSEYFSCVIPIYVAVIFLFTLANFSMATFMDPGVFPRGKHTWTGCLPEKVGYDVLTWLSQYMTDELWMKIIVCVCRLQRRRMKTKKTISALRSTKRWRSKGSKCAWSGAQPAASTVLRAARTARSVTTVWRYTRTLELRDLIRNWYIPPFHTEWVLQGQWGWKQGNGLWLTWLL